MFLVIYHENENMYLHGKVKISDLINRLLHEFLGLPLAIILIIFFCNVNIFLLLHELPQKIIPYFIREWK
jgi:hypothetical protein